MRVNFHPIIEGIEDVSQIYRVLDITDEYGNERGRAG